MARVVLSGLVNEISGSTGALTWSSWKGVSYIREKAQAVSNPNSGDQVNIRARLTALSKRWANTLTQGQRDLWEDYATGMGSSSKSQATQGAGSRIVIPVNNSVMSGFNAYLMINAWGYSAGVFALGVYQDDAPAVEPPNAPTVFSIAWDAPTCCLDLNWTDPEAPPAITDGRIRVWLVSTPAGVHRQLVASVAEAVETYQACAVKIALGAQVNIRDKPGQYLVQIDFVDQFGQKSPPSRVAYIAVPSGCTPA